MALTTASKDQKELQRKTFARTMATSEEMRALVRERVQRDLASRGVTASEEELEKLTEESIQAAIRTGSADDAEKAFTKQAAELFYSFATPGAKHDDSVRYVLPFDPEVPRMLGQGVNGDMGIRPRWQRRVESAGRSRLAYRSHEARVRLVDAGRYAVLAARDGASRAHRGRVRRKRQRSRLQHPNVGDRPEARRRHVERATSGSIPTSRCRSASRSRRAKCIGKTGSTAWSNSWNGSVGVHFDVVRLDDDGERETVDIRFDDGSPTASCRLPAATTAQAARRRRPVPVRRSEENHRSTASCRQRRRVRRAEAQTSTRSRGSGASCSHCTPRSIPSCRSCGARPRSNARSLAHRRRWIRQSGWRSRRPA